MYLRQNLTVFLAKEIKSKPTGRRLANKNRIKVSLKYSKSRLRVPVK